jgi:hypothetical protein
MENKQGKKGPEKGLRSTKNKNKQTKQLKGL